MKRNFIKKYKHGIFTTLNLFFWNQCCVCKHEFRRETIWRFLAGPFHGGAGHWYYLCKSCAPTEQDAHDLVINNCYIPKRPIAPPPPPPRPVNGIQAIRAEV